MTNTGENFEYVILTTISTIQRYNKNNPDFFHYYVETDEGRKYCDGIVSVEPGTKYFLSKYPVKRIIAVSSDESLKSTGSQKQENVRAKKLINRFKNYDSATGLFYNNICRYYYNIIPKTQSNVDAKRCRELIQIIQGVLKGNPDCKKESGLKHINVWFDLISRYDLSGSIRNEIKKAIEAEFNNKEDINNISKDWREYEESFEEMIDNKTATVLDFEKWLEENGKKLSLVEKGVLCLNLREKLNLWFKDQKFVNSKDFGLYKENVSVIFDRYDKFSAALSKELDTIKTNRIQTETKEIIHYLYKRMSDNKKLKPQPSAEHTPPLFSYVEFNDTNRISDIIDAIINNQPADKRIKLLVDVQGGYRTTGLVLNSILKILNNTGKLEDCKFSSVNFEAKNFANEIIDQTQQYKIIDLTNAIDAFINYGKANELKKIFKNTEIDGLKNAVDKMTEFSDALSLCRISNIEDTVKDIYEYLDGLKEQKSNNTLESAFISLIPDIKAGFVEIKNGNVETRDIIKWAVDHYLIQQALCIVKENFYKTKAAVDFINSLTTGQLKVFIESAGKSIKASDNNCVSSFIASQVNMNNVQYSNSKGFLINDFALKHANELATFLYLKQQRNQTSHTDEEFEQKNKYPDICNYLKLSQTPSLEEVQTVLKDSYNSIGNANKDEYDRASDRILKMKKILVLGTDKPHVIYVYNKSVDGVAVAKRMNNFKKLPNENTYNKKDICFCDGDRKWDDTMYNSINPDSGLTYVVFNSEITKSSREKKYEVLKKHIKNNLLADYKEEIKMLVDNGTTIK